jgi:hypothetical protein
LTKKNRQNQIKEKKMKTQNTIKAASVNGILLAISLENELEAAGIPASIVVSGDGMSLDVLVPVESIFDALGLLAPDRPCGEIFFVPARPS